MNKLTPSRRPVQWISLVVMCASLAACGGGDEPGIDSADASASREEAQGILPSGRFPAPPPPAPAGSSLELGIKIAGFPHKIDVYRPPGATRAIVFLHGNGGTTGSLAYLLGFSVTAYPSARTINWDWLTRNGIIAVLPQGQAAPGSTVGTWNNYIAYSGQDDVAFLSALATNVRTKYGVADVSLAGYSAGGVMTGRVWCEATTAFKSFVSIAGPMMSGTGTGVTCTPPTTAPYFVMLGAKDQVLPTYNPGLPAPTPEQAAAGLTTGFLVAEWKRDSDRTRWVCGETTQLGGATVSPVGPTWNNCSTRIRYSVVKNADHTIPSFETATGVKMVDTIAGFTH